MAAAATISLDDQLPQLEARAGDATIHLIRNRPGDWTAIVSDADEQTAQSDNVVYASGHGDTAADAVDRLLSRRDYLAL